jgi:hypothetical protein
MLEGFFKTPGLDQELKIQESIPRVFILLNTMRSETRFCQESAGQLSTQV